MKAQHIHAKDVQELEKVRINSIGSSWNFHYGKITSLGNTDICLGGRDVDIQWDGAPASGMCGAIPDGKWEIFKLAFAGSGRIRILSDKQATSDWMFDYRYLDALKKNHSFLSCIDHISSWFFLSLVYKIFQDPDHSCLFHTIIVSPAIFRCSGIGSHRTCQASARGSPALPCRCRRQHASVVPGETKQFFNKNPVTADPVQ